MNSKLPREVLEQIFTHPDISKKEILCLQLTCQQWRSVAQKHLYKAIHLNDKSLYKTEDDTSSSKLHKRLKLLTRTLLFLSIHIRSCIKVINIDALLDPNVANDSFDYVASELATLFHLCPNITTLQGLHLSPGFYKAISSLHADGKLQNLEYLSAPTYNTVPVLSSYRQAIDVFGSKMKEISVIDGVCEAMATGDCLIEPENLRRYPRVEHLHLKELSRIHLSIMSDYISNCAPSTKSIGIELGEMRVLVDDYDDQLAIVSQTQIRRLSLRLSRIPLTMSEMDVVIRMFPSLESFKCELMLFETVEVDPSMDNVDLVVQFFDYLSQIPRVEYHRMMFGVSDGLRLLPHLARSMDTQHLFLTSNESEDFAAIFLNLDRECQLVQTTSNQKTIKTKHSSLAVGVFSDDTRASFQSALAAFKDQPIKRLRIGKAHGNLFENFQQITEDSMDYIVENFSSLQRLTYSYIEFPSNVSKVNTPRVKHLHLLHLNQCNMTDDYFTKLSCQYEHVNLLKYSASDAHEFKYNANGNKIRIHLPYTTVNTLDLSDLGLSCFTIKVWVNLKYSEFIANQGLSRKFQVIVHCKSLKEIRTGSALFRLPPCMRTDLGKSDT